MKNEDELFRLIKSLSPNEKKNFKLFVKLHNFKKETNYLKLFNFLDRQKEYDINSINKFFKGNKFIKQLNVTKKYLFDIIVNSLIFHKNDSAECTIESLISQSDILKQRGFANLSYKYLMKSYSIAKIQDEFVLLLSILSKKLSLSRFLNFENLDLIIKNINEERKKTISIISRVNYLDSLIDSIEFMQQIKGIPIIDFNERNIFIDEFKNDINELENYQLQETNTEKEKSLYARYKYFATISENNKAIDAFNNLLLLFENNSALMIKNPMSYYVSVLNLILFLSRLNYLIDIEKYLNKIHNLKFILPKSIWKNIEKKISFDLLSLRLEINNHNGNFSENVEIIGQFDYHIKKVFLNEISLNINHAYTLAYSYFCLNKLEKGLEWCEVIKRNYNKCNRDDLFLCSEMLRLLIHYELKNSDLLGYEIVNFYRIIKKRKIHTKTEANLIAFIRDIIRTNSKKEIRDIIHKYIINFKNLINVDKGFSLLNNLDLLSYLESKFYNISFDKVIKSKLLSV